MRKKDNTYRVVYRRKREGRTNYKKRLKLLVSNKLRLVVRKTLNNIIVSVVSFDSKGDKVVVCAHSAELKKMGWKYKGSNIPSAYLTGLIAGKKAMEKNINDLVLDIGLNPSVSGSKIYAALAGVIDAGIKVAHNPEILPNEDRLKGKHIHDYANKLKEDKERFDKQFNSYNKTGVDPLNIVNDFNKVKESILGGKNGSKKQ